MLAFDFPGRDPRASRAFDRRWGKRRGDAPSDKPDPRAVRYVLRFEVTAETYALFREALRELRRRSSSCCNDDAALLEMARCVLGGTVGRRDEGRSSYQIAISLCPECGSGRQPANGQLVAVAPEIAAMAECDAQRLPALDENASHRKRSSADAAEPAPRSPADAHAGNASVDLAPTPQAFARQPGHPSRAAPRGQNYLTNFSPGGWTGEIGPSLAAIVIHEKAHEIDIGMGGPGSMETYRAGPCLNLAITNPDAASKDAESYAFFVADAHVTNRILVPTTSPLY